MHFFAEYGSEAAHWQYKERGYGASSAPATSAPGQATASVDDDVPTAAGAAVGVRGRADAAREANWAKFVLSQQVADQKFRPSGSPTQDTSLVALVGLVGAAAPSAAVAAAAPAAAGSSGEDDSPSGSPPKDERFAAYLERSGQKLEPPPAGACSFWLAGVGGVGDSLCWGWRAAASALGKLLSVLLSPSINPSTHLKPLHRRARGGGGRVPGRPYH